MCKNNDKLLVLSTRARSAHSSWFFTITLICLPLATASNASADLVSGNLIVMSCLRSTTPRESMSMAEGKHEAV